jgi:hypothetical protein
LRACCNPAPRYLLDRSRPARATSNTRGRTRRFAHLGQHPTRPAERRLGCVLQSLRCQLSRRRTNLLRASHSLPTLAGVLFSVCPNHHRYISRKSGRPHIDYVRSYLRGWPSVRSPNGHRAPEAVQDLVFDAVADVRAQLTGPRPPLETVTTGTLWSLVRQPVTRHDDPERTPWTSCR